jgi:hypothetical protein
MHSIGHHQYAVKFSTIVQICETFQKEQTGLQIRPINENEKLLTKDFVVDGTLVFNYLLTYSMEQSPTWEANWFCS